MIALIISLLISLGIIGSESDYYNLSEAEQQQYEQQYEQHEDIVVEDIIGM